jgi:hypothetical protein
MEQSNEERIKQLERDVQYHVRMREYEKAALKELAEYLGYPKDTATDTVDRAIFTMLHQKQRNADLTKGIEQVLESLSELMQDFDRLGL